MPKYMLFVSVACGANRKLAALTIRVKTGIMIYNLAVTSD